MKPETKTTRQAAMAPRDSLAALRLSAALRAGMIDGFSGDDALGCPSEYPLGAWKAGVEQGRKNKRSGRDPLSTDKV